MFISYMRVSKADEIRCYTCSTMCSWRQELGGTTSTKTSPRARVGIARGLPRASKR